MKDETVNPLIVLQTGDGFLAVGQKTRKQILFHSFPDGFLLRPITIPNYIAILYQCFPYTLSSWSFTTEFEIGSVSLLPFYGD